MNAIKKKPVIDISNINEKVYGLIKERIIYREYPPGDQINVRKLQDELGVSNSPIINALFKLSGEGLVEITSRKGTYVKDISERDIQEIEEVRIMLETGAVDLIIDKITDEQIRIAIAPVHRARAMLRLRGRCQPGHSGWANPGR